MNLLLTLSRLKVVKVVGVMVAVYVLEHIVGSPLVVETVSVKSV